MPKVVDDFVEQRLADKDFYPDKTEEERKSIAFALANKLLDEGKLSSTVTFTQTNAPTEISIQATEDGDLIVFKGAILARAETNKNKDDISPENIEELASTIAGRAIDIEHDLSMNCGVFTGGRRQDDALSVDGVIWKDRYPEEGQAVLDGIMQLSIEASAREAVCSTCGQSFADASAYCDHLRMRGSNGARRGFRGLRAKGGALTKRPAGSDTRFDQQAIYMVASHQEPGEAEKEKDTSKRALSAQGPGGSAGSQRDGGTRQEPASAEGSSARDILSSDQSSTQPSEATMNDDEKKKEQEALQSQLAEMTQALEKAKGDLATANTTLATVTAERDALATEAKELRAKQGELSASLQTKTDELATLTATYRRAMLPGMSDEDWAKSQKAVLSMTVEAFDLFASQRPAAQTSGIAGVRLPEQSAGTGVEAVTLN